MTQALGMIPSEPDLPKSQLNDFKAAVDRLKAVKHLKKQPWDHEAYSVLNSPADQFLKDCMFVAITYVEMIERLSC